MDSHALKLLRLVRMFILIVVVIPVICIRILVLLILAHESFMFDSASVNSISSMPSPVYQWRKAFLLNIAVN